MMQWEPRGQYGSTLEGRVCFYVEMNGTSGRLFQMIKGVACHIQDYATVTDAKSRAEAILRVLEP